MRSMKILKFGGTSVGKPERMQSVAQLVLKEQGRKIVVLSALSGITNQLVEVTKFLADGKKEEALEKAKEIIDIHLQFITNLYKDEKIMSKARNFLDEHKKTMLFWANQAFTVQNERKYLAEGELLSTHLFNMYLEEHGFKTAMLPALDIMRIDENEEPVASLIEENLNKYLERTPEVEIFITQGYICRNHLNEIDNLKRGGSDYTASLVGAAVRAQEIQIWTDIDGMHNNDPRYVKNTFPVAELSFEEAAELAYFGAKILHPATIHPAQKYNIPVRLLNTMQPEAKGTTIQDNASSQQNIKSIAAKDGITAIKIKSSRMLLAYGFLRKIFEIFEKYKTPIDMITTSEVAVSLTIDNATYLNEIKSEIEKFAVIEVDVEQTIICVVGNFVADKKGLVLSVFEALKEIPIRMISYGGSEHNISLLLNTSFKNEALNALNDGLFVVKQIA